MSASQDSIKVVVCAPIMGSDLGRLRTVDAKLEIIDGTAAFDAFRRASGRGDREAVAAAERELKAVIAPAEISCMGYPVLPGVLESAPNLRWFHHTQAGVSNLWGTDVWTADHILVTNGRGRVRPTAMAEYAVAGALLFARGLHDGYLDKTSQRLDRSQRRRWESSAWVGSARRSPGSHARWECA